VLARQSRHKVVGKAVSWAIVSEANPDTVLDGESLAEADYVELDEATPESYKVAYSGQDFDVDGLVRRLNRGDMLVPQFGHNDDRIATAGFQRNFVWSKPQMDRFIESLLLGYPIPSILLVRQPDKRYLILDGQQRLRTLQRFYAGEHQDRPFTLNNVSDEFRGLAYATLDDSQRRMIDNTYIQATIVDTDGSSESQEAIYQIFERLNSGGTQLTPHEIRVALYAGGLIDLMDSLNQDQNWRKVYGTPSPRLRDQELVLRIVAFYCTASTYVRPLKRFLNQFTAVHRDGADPEVLKAAAQFRRAAFLVAAGPGNEAMRRRSRQLNVAQTDAIFVALMHELNDRDLTSQQVFAAVDAIRNDNVLDTVMTSGTSSEEAVQARLDGARTAFRAV
jgi:hypothetical protein